MRQYYRWKSDGCLQVCYFEGEPNLAAENLQVDFFYSNLADFALNGKHSKYETGFYSH